MAEKKDSAQTEEKKEETTLTTPLSTNTTATGNTSNKTTTSANSAVSSKEKKAASAPVKKQIVKPVKGVLRSGNPFPTEYKYKGESAFIPPSGRIPNVVKDYLTYPLPNGVKFIPDVE